MITFTFRYPHHGTYSSYHRLVDYLGDGDIVVDASMPKWMYGRYFNPRGFTQRYWRAKLEKKAWRMAQKGGHRWLHYIYPENSYFLGSQFKKSADVNLAMTCHLPQDTLEGAGERMQTFKDGLLHANALVVMSPDYVDYYRELAPQARVEFIPHGVDVHYFKPAETARDRPVRAIRLLTVGSMLRDFGTLAEVINIAASCGMDWKFQVLARQDRLVEVGKQLSEGAKKLFEPLYNVSNKTLLELYQDSDLLYLPLLDATANNAVVEAMACGLPMLLSDFPATRSYAEDVADYILGNDPSEAYEKIAYLVSDKNSLRSKGEAARAMAVKNLSWEAIVDRHRAFFSGNSHSSVTV